MHGEFTFRARHTACFLIFSVTSVTAGPTNIDVAISARKSNIRQENFFWEYRNYLLSTIFVVTSEINAEDKNISKKNIFSNLQ